MYQNYETYVHTSNPTPGMFWFEKSHIFEFPEEDSNIQPRIAVEGTYKNQSSEKNCEGNSIKNTKIVNCIYSLVYYQIGKNRYSW